MVEGETVTLNCTVHHDNTSHLQWSNPRSYVAFFNGIKGKCGTIYQQDTREAGDREVLTLANFRSGQHSSELVGELLVVVFQLVILVQETVMLDLVDYQLL